MKINTDLVKNKKFSSSVKPSLLKYSQEYRVLATLRYLFPEKFEAMIRGETPDLQDSINRIGIEVTVAVKEDDMKASRAFYELNQGEAKEIEKNEKIIKECGYSFTTIKNERDLIYTFGTADGEKYYFQESIRRKTKKLQQYRTNFKRIGLAILLTEIPTAYAENHLSEWISQAFDMSENMFDFVYVISHRFCLYYDTKEKITRKHLLNKDENSRLATIGRMTAEGELSLADSEWL